MAEFEKSVAAMEADMNQRMAPYQGGVPSWALPENQHKNWSKILTDRPSTSNEMVPAEMSSSRSMAESSESSSPDKWTVSLDVQKFTPESLKVKVAGDLVTISGAMVSIAIKRTQRMNLFFFGKHSTNLFYIITFTLFQ